MRGGRVVWGCFAFVVGCGGNATVDGQRGGATPSSSGGSGGSSGAGAVGVSNGGSVGIGGTATGSFGGNGSELPNHGRFDPGNGSGGAAPVPGDAGAPTTPRTPLRNTPVRAVPVLDPDRVYVIGQTTELLADPSSLRAIAPIDDPTDSIGGAPLFANYVLRRTDGHLAYSYLGSEQGIGWTTPLYELRRDDLHALDITAGETVLENGRTQCNLPVGYTVRYRMAYDGAITHTCPDRLITGPGIPDSTSAWLTASGTQLPWLADFAVSIGPTNRALAGKADATIVVYDFATGEEYGSFPPRLFSTSNGNAAYPVAVRSRADGFYVVAAAADKTTRCEMVNVNLNGQIISRTDCPSLPENVTVNSDYWFVPVGAIGGDGAYYHFAIENGDTTVVVRRPVEGASTVVYRKPPVLIDAPPQFVLAEELLSGI